MIGKIDFEAVDNEPNQFHVHIREASTSCIKHHAHLVPGKHSSLYKKVIIQLLQKYMHISAVLLTCISKQKEIHFWSISAFLESFLCMARFSMTGIEAITITTGYNFNKIVDLPTLLPSTSKP